MDALTAFASLGLYAIPLSRRQEPPQALFLDVLEALLAEICLGDLSSAKLNTATVAAARMTAMWLERQKPEDASITRLLAAILDALTGEDEKALAALEGFTPQARALVYRAYVAALSRKGADDILSPDMVAALLKDRAVEWHVLVDLARRSSDPVRAMSATIEGMGALETGELLRMVADKAWWTEGAARAASKHIMDALNRAQPRLPPEKVSLLRCLFGENTQTIPASPSDWAVVLRACEDAPTDEVKHAVLTIVGDNSAWMILDGTVQDCLRRGELEAHDALRLLQVAVPFLDKRDDDAAALICDAFKVSPLSVQDQVDVCVRLWQDAVPSAELARLAERQDPIGAMAAARLAQRSPEIAELHKLRYPYYLVADLGGAIAQAPIAMLKALAEEISPTSVDTDIQLTCLVWRLWELDPAALTWRELAPAERGVLLGAWLSRGDISPKQTQEVVDRCLDGLSADGVAVVAKQARVLVEELGSCNRRLKAYEIAYDRFFDLASARGCQERLPPPEAVISRYTTPLEAVVRYIRAGDIASYKEEFLSHLEHVKTPEEAAQFAAALVRYFPDPSKADGEYAKCVATWAAKSNRQTLRAFLDALSPNWQIAIAIATSGRTLSPIGNEYLFEFVARFPPREQALLLTLKPIREALGEANAPRPLNRVEFQMTAQAFVSAIPQEIDYAPLSPEVGAFVGALLGQGKGAEIPTAVFEYAASLQRGHYPLAAAAPTSLPVIPRRLERPNPRAH